MRPQTYDTIIDTAAELSKYSGWFCLALGLIGLLMAVVYLILVQGFDFPIPVMFFTISTVLISFFGTIFIFMMVKAKKRFGVDKWRDFWMAFGHPYRIDGGYNKRERIDEWLDENIPRLYRVITKDSDILIVFRHKEDAMACKLRWS